MTTTTTNEEERILEVPLYCLHRDCEKRGLVALINPSGRGYGYDPRDGWVAWAPGFPSLRSLGFCPEHQRFTVTGGGPALDVVVKADRGVYFEISRSGVMLGTANIPTNTLVMQPGTETASDEFKAAIRRVEAVLDVSKRDPRKIPRRASRAELLTSLTGRDQLTPIEVTAENVETLRREFALSDLGAGNIVWHIPNSKLFGVAYSWPDQQAPLRAMIAHIVPQQHGRAVYVGDAVIVGHRADQDDSPWLRFAADGFVSLITGQPVL